MGVGVGGIVGGRVGIPVALTGEGRDVIGEGLQQTFHPQAEDRDGILWDLEHCQPGLQVLGDMHWVIVVVFEPEELLLFLPLGEELLSLQVIQTL